MYSSSRYYLVAAEVLPEVFIKVAEANRLLHTGEIKTATDAVRRVGISRSVYYKYRDAIQPFTDMAKSHIVTFYALLKNYSGVLSDVLSVFAQSGANILTINQSIPTNGCAAVTIAAETAGLTCPLEALITAVSALDGAVRFEILAG